MIRIRWRAVFAGSALVFVLACAGGPRAGARQAEVIPQMVGRPNPLPQVPPEGAWGEVVNATDRWIVVQNHAGQQFPIAVMDTGRFLVRWPYTLDMLGAESLVEAYGRDLGSNTLETAHLDVYEGTDRTLVSPSFSRVGPRNANLPTPSPVFSLIYNSVLNSWGYPGTLSMYGWAYPVAPNGTDEVALPLHLVGPPLDRVPLRLAIPGNNAAGVVPGRNIQFSITQVTRGSMQYVRKGDVAYLIPIGVKPSGIVVSQLVLYKNIPFVRFKLGR